MTQLLEYIGLFLAIVALTILLLFHSIPVDAGVGVFTIIIGYVAGIARTSVAVMNSATSTKN